MDAGAVVPGMGIPAFSRRAAPEINGIAGRVSADISQDQKTAATLYIGISCAAQRWTIGLLRSGQIETTSHSDTEKKY
jgi:hypothetical protein